MKRESLTDSFDGDLYFESPLMKEIQIQIQVETRGSEFPSLQV